MNKKNTRKIQKQDYNNILQQLQVELVKLQNHIIKNDDKILIIFEGRDAGGKDGTIKRIIQHLSPRETRVVALGKPSDATSVPGIFNATPRICPPLKRWYCSIAVGTTARVWSE